MVRGPQLYAIFSSLIHTTTHGFHLMIIPSTILCQETAQHADCSRRGQTSSSQAAHEVDLGQSDNLVIGYVASVGAPRIRGAMLLSPCPTPLTDLPSEAFILLAMSHDLAN
jgi:hypothetical protein